MLELFTTKLPPIFQGITVNQDLKYIREYYNGVIDKVISYRSENIWFVKGEHILNRFLKLFLSPEGMKDIEYFKMIDTYSNSACRNLQFSTMYNTGNFHKNNIFKGSTEIYYVKSEVLPLDKIGSTWKSFNPIKVLYTDNRVFDITVPDSMYNNEVSIIMEIDLFKLMFHYKYWYEERAFRDLDNSTEAYLGSWLMPTLLRSYLDYTSWNIASRLITDRTYIPVFRSKVPFSVSDYTKRLTSGYLEYIDRFRYTKNSFSKILENIPMIYSSNALELMNLPKDFYTRQSIWLPLYCRMGVLISLLELTGTNGKIANSNFTSGIKRTVRSILNLEHILPDNTPKYIEREFYYMLFRLERLADL